ncbi:hypothetical protein FGL97_04820 [Pseudomonas putida]|nr:hypothetical protein [Pseudomonas putida]NVN67801.1 hypothetical protein [Pseudomonas putida]
MSTHRSPLPPLPYSRVNPPLHTHRWFATGRRRSGFTRERAGPAGQSQPAVHRCRRYRIRG